MKLWLDDLRTPPDDEWTWAKTAVEAIGYLEANSVVEMSLDHDLGGQGYGSEDTSRPVVLWLCEQADEVWPRRITVHSWNPAGADWLVGMCERYSPWQGSVPYIPSDRHWAGEQYEQEA